MHHGDRKHAFTLIELLVVIAIIAILAAILFPVFAQAREKARETSCLSNEKQLTMGILMYNQDYDEQFPAGEWNWSYTPPGSAGGTMTWCQQIQPYIKNWQLFRCPDSETDPFGIWNGSQGNIKWWYNWMRWPAYGFNWNYLNANPGDCSVWLPGGGPTNDAQIAQPAQTVMLTDVKYVGTSAGFYISSTIDSPAAIWAPDCCTWSNGGWGVGAYGDTINYAAMPTYTGMVDPRHMGGSNISFTDGHAKWMTMGALAAGTNWRAGLTSGAIIITDRTQYIWDLQ
jgi:prepilin-type N-terminal cleavage/methylation domain-containing protein/prepilin-type processing-associated H-X9-DG protein